MKTYVERESLSDLIDTHLSQSFGAEHYAYGVIKNGLKDIPNAYVKEIVYAEWVYDHWCEFKCSNCGNWSDSKPYKGKEKYCPECGAKMKNT